MGVKPAVITIIDVLMSSVIISDMGIIPGVEIMDIKINIQCPAIIVELFPAMAEATIKV
jgi:hypothetical protein